MAITGLSSRLAELAEASAKDKAAAEKRKEETLDKLANFSKSKKGGDDDDDDSDDGMQQQHSTAQHSRGAPHSDSAALTCPAHLSRAQTMMTRVTTTPTSQRTTSSLKGRRWRGRSASSVWLPPLPHARPIASARALSALWATSTPGRRSSWTTSVVRMCRMGRRVVSLSRLARHSSRRRRSSIVWVP